MDDVTEKYLSWFNDDRARRYISAGSVAQSLDSLRGFVFDRIGRADALFMGIFAKDSNTHIGNIKFEPIDLSAKSAVVGILIGDPYWRGIGAAPEVLNACIEWLYYNRSVETITLGVDKSNLSAIRAYEKIGFVIEPNVPSEKASAREISYTMRRRRLRNAERLVLGTVQFGMNYGVANQSGQVPASEVEAILAYASAAGIKLLDTAISYGRSEQNLGQSGVRSWKVITKLPPVPPGITDIAGWAKEEVKQSLLRLRVDCLEAILMHRASDFFGLTGDQLEEALLDLKREGLVNKIGVSIYHPGELDSLVGVRPVDLVQAPFSLLDRRILSSGWMGRLHQIGVELHVRSIFLQGLLLSENMQRDPRFSNWSSLWQSLSAWLKDERMNPLQACLGFVLGHPEVSKIVVGVDGKAQLIEILGQLNVGKVNPPESLISNDLSLIQPSRWIS